MPLEYFAVLAAHFFCFYDIELITVLEFPYPYIDFSIFHVKKPRIQILKFSKITIVIICISSFLFQKVSVQETSFLKSILTEKASKFIYCLMTFLLLTIHFCLDYHYYFHLQSLIYDLLHHRIFKLPSIRLSQVLYIIFVQLSKKLVLEIMSSFYHKLIPISLFIYLSLKTRFLNGFYSLNRAHHKFFLKRVSLTLLLQSPLSKIF